MPSRNKNWDIWVCFHKTRCFSQRKTPRTIERCNTAHWICSSSGLCWIFSEWIVDSWNSCFVAQFRQGCTGSRVFNEVCPTTGRCNQPWLASLSGHTTLRLSPKAISSYGRGISFINCPSRICSWQVFEVSTEKEETPGLKDGIALTSINGRNAVTCVKVQALVQQIVWHLLIGFFVCHIKCTTTYPKQWAAFYKMLLVSIREHLSAYASLSVTQNHL